MNSVFSIGETPTTLARICDRSGNTMTPSQFSGGKYSIFKVGENNEIIKAITGHRNVEIDSSCFCEPTVSNGWNLDSVGYNFLFTPDTRVNQAFNEAGTYRIDFELEVLDDVPVIFRRYLIFK